MSTLTTASEEAKPAPSNGLTARAGDAAARTQEYLAPLMRGRVTVLGVGNRMRGDDGAGSFFAEHLAGVDGVTAIDAEDVLENHLEKVARSRPDTILIVDAVDFGGKTGEMRFLAPDNVSPTGVSTHASSLRIAVNYLKTRTQARVKVLGIQPADLSLGQSLSPEVSDAIRSLARVFLGQPVANEMDQGSVPLVLADSRCNRGS